MNPGATSAHASATRAPTSATRLILLVALAMFITYVDRGNLATAAPLIEKELRLSPERLGVLLSAFYVTYMLAMVPSGWLAERYGARVVLAGGLFVWSLATVLTGVAGSFATLMLLRLMLGVGESVTFPSMSKLIASGVEPARIGLANGVVTFGYLIGPAAGTFLGGLLMAWLGWRPVFVLFGLLSMLWLLPWSRTVVAQARVAEGVTDGPSFPEILRQRGLWGASLGHFAGNYTFFFILAWLPEYLVKVRGFSMQTMAGVAGFAYFVNALAGLVGGWAMDQWARSGGSVNLAYKGIMTLNHLVAIGGLFGMVLLPVVPSIACLFAYQIAMGLASPGIFAIPQLLAGPTATARWVGVQNMFGAVAGVFAPAITGFIIGASGHYERAFALAALINGLGLVGWLLILPRIAPIAWRLRSAA